MLSQLSTIIWAVGRKRPPLCRGCAPATPPYKTMPHRPCLLFPSIVSGERSLLPPCCLIPLTLAVPQPLTPAVPPQFPCRSAPPQRPPTKPSLTDLVCAFQPCGSSSVSSQQCLLPHLPPQPTDHRPLISGVHLTTGVPLTTDHCSSDRICAFQHCRSTNLAAADRIRSQFA